MCRHGLQRRYPPPPHLPARVFVFLTHHLTQRTLLLRNPFFVGHPSCAIFLFALKSMLGAATARWYSSWKRCCDL